MTAPWTSSEVSASGQVFEFRLWAALTEQSRGLLHVFLPLTDRGIDGLVHRQTDGAYLPIQAKGRSSLEKGEVHVVVWADSLKDDRALLVSGLIVDGGLGPTMLVVPEGDFKRLAITSANEGRPIYSMGFGMHPTAASRWFPFLVPTQLLAERLGIPAVPVTLEELGQPHPMWRSDVGFLGEAEVIRVLAESGDLNLFRPFPDLETSELAILHLDSRKVLGIQVKTRSIDVANPAATVNIRELSFRPSSTTYFVVLAWLREKAQFHGECLLIPSEEFRGICQPQETHGQLKFEWHPGSTAHSHLDPYRVPLSDLQSRVMLKLIRDA
jgi:hypothetical protein